MRWLRAVAIVHQFVPFIIDAYTIINRISQDKETQKLLKRRAVAIAVKRAESLIDDLERELRQ